MGGSKERFVCCHINLRGRGTAAAALAVLMGLVFISPERRISPLFLADLNKYDKDYQEFVLKTAETLSAKRVIGPTLIYEVTDNPWLEKGLVLDIGVFLGSSTRVLARLMGNRTTIHGFDTFSGFPGGQAWYIDDFEYQTKFAFTEAWVSWLIRDQGLEIKDGVPSTMGYNIAFHRGLTFDTLPLVLDADPHKPVTFMHVDIDTYEGALHALETCRKRMIVGTTIVFDEFFVLNGEIKAFYEFQRKYSFNYTLSSWGHDMGFMNVNGFRSALGFVFAWGFVQVKLWQLFLGLRHSHSWADYAILLTSHVNNGIGIRISGLGNLHSDL